MAQKFHVGGWVGRIGNHLLQVGQAIFLAERYNGICTYAKEPFLKDKVFDFSGGEPVTDTFHESFFEPNPKYALDGRPYHEDLHRERPRIMREYVLPIFKPYEKLDWNHDLVINVRGGDTLDHKANPQYVQAPLSYFTTIIEKEGAERILVVAEDERNPVVDALRRSDHSVDAISDQSPFVDANMVLNTETLVFGGISTFHHTMAQMSPHLKKVYYPEFGDGWELGPDEQWRRAHWYKEGDMLGNIPAVVERLYFTDYVPIGQWDRYTTEEKCQRILTHPAEKVHFDRQLQQSGSRN